MKAKRKPAPAPVVFGAPDATMFAGSRPEIEPTRDELANGWTAETLAAFMRTACTTPYEYQREVLWRAQERRRQASEAVAAFKQESGTEDLAAEDKARLKELERALASASAAVDRAAAAHDVEC